MHYFSEFPSARLRWFRTFAMNVSQVYDDDANLVELDIKLRADQKTGA